MNATSKKNSETNSTLDNPPGRWVAFAIHFYTTTGLIFSVLILSSIIKGELALAFLWMTMAVLVDATDGTFARRYRVWEVTPEIDGRKLDDIVDYVNYTFLPVMLICQAGWLPNPAWLWGCFPLVASAFAFAHVGAKEDDAGFFRGFPSYWNVVAFYIWVSSPSISPWFVLLLVISLSFLSLMPVRFVYPNKAPRWKGTFVFGGIVWAILLVVMMARHPTVPAWLVLASVVYPTFYVIASAFLSGWSER